MLVDFINGIRKLDNHCTGQLFYGIAHLIYALDVGVTFLLQITWDLFDAGKMQVRLVSTSLL